MKTIFITISDAEVSHNIVWSDVFRILKDKVRIVLFVNPKKAEYFRKKISSPNIIIEPSPPSSFPRMEEAFADIFLYSLHTNCIRVKIENSYYSGGNFIARAVKLFLWFCGRFYIVRWFWRKIYELAPDNSFDRFFGKYKPDAVFAANLTSVEDVRILKASRRFGTISFGMPKSWDNLTSKAFLRIFPDWLLVQTPFVKSDAVGQDYPEGRIKIAGFPKFDVYAKLDSLLPRDVFLRKLGLNPSWKTILYAGAGDQLAPYDEEILRDFLEEIKQGKVTVPVQIIVRPHPKYVYRKEIIPSSSLWVYDRPNEKKGEIIENFEFEEDVVAHLMNSVAHCDLLIHTASTLGIEAAIFDRPMITLAFDGTKKRSEALSVLRYYKYEHIKRVMATGGMKRANNLDELIQLTNDYLLHPERDREGRKQMARENAYVTDGKAGERVAEFILREVGLQSVVRKLSMRRRGSIT